jgi:hypothetical protein
MHLVEMMPSDPVHRCNGRSRLDLPVVLFSAIPFVVEAVAVIAVKFSFGTDSCKVLPDAF